MGDEKEKPDKTDPTFTPKVQKRSAPASSSDGGQVASPKAKRARKQAELYQSDVIEACSKQTKSGSERREVFVPKGAYLAVRSEDGFYLCQTLHYVYDDNLGPIQIQWMEQKKKSDLYELAYIDNIDRESVLTELKLVPGGERGVKKLQEFEKERINKILGFSIQKEQGLLKGIDSSNLAEAVEASLSKSAAAASAAAAAAAPRSSTPSRRKSSTPSRRRPSPPSEDEEDLEEEKKTRHMPKRGQAKSQGQKRRPVVKLRHLKPVVKLTKLKERKASQQRRKARGAAPKKIQKQNNKQTSAATPRDATKGKKDKDMNKKLKPNTSIELCVKDPTFEVRNENEMPDESKAMMCKKAIRAVLTNDTNLLRDLINERQRVPTVFGRHSIATNETALHFALKVGNVKALEMLMDERASKKERSYLQAPVLEKSETGRYHYMTLGHHTRPLNVARGGKEGNNAFIKDIEQYNTGTSTEELVRCALENEAPIQTFDVMAKYDDSVRVIARTNIYLAVRCGNRKLAGQLTQRAIKDGGYGFNKVHEHALLSDKPETLPQVQAVSVKKKSIDNAKMTPLHCAAINPNAKILAQLLTQFPGYNIGDQHGWTPVHYAAACEGAGPLELLLARGVPTDSVTSKGLTPLMIAAKLGRIQNMAELLKPRKSTQASLGQNVRDVDRKDAQGFAAVHYAAEKGEYEACQLLAGHDANLEATTSAPTDKKTALMLAAMYGHLPTVKILAELGVSLEAKDKTKRTALAHAVMNGQFPVASLLLRKGADPNNVDSSGNTPLHYAAGYGWWYCVKLLLKAGAQPNTMNDWNVPPLGISFMKGHIGCAELLLKQAGVDVNFRDSDGWTLAMLAAGFQLSSSSLKQLKFLVENKKADVTLTDTDGWNVLHHLAANPSRTAQEPYRGNYKKIAVEMAKILIDNGCNPSTVTGGGETALSIAVKQKNLNSSLVHFLMENGAQLSLDANEKGENILHLMAKSIKDSSQSDMFYFVVDMLRKPQLCRESPVTVRPANQEQAAAPVQKSADLKDKMQYSPGQMPVLQQEANHIKNSSSVKPKLDSQEIVKLENKQVNSVNGQKGGITNDPSLKSGQPAGDSKVVGIVNGQVPLMNEHDTKEPVQKTEPQKTESEKIAQVVPKSKTEDTLEENKPLLGIDSPTKSTVVPGKMIELKTLIAMKDETGFNPLHRLIATYREALATGKARSDLTTDVLNVMKGFIEEAKPDIDAYTGNHDPEARPDQSAKCCLHFLVTCRLVAEDGTNIGSQVLQEFLKYKPALNLLDYPERRTPLIEAICAKKHAAVSLLIKAGADVNTCSGNEITDKRNPPLMMAAKTGQLALITKLLNKGVNVNYKERDSQKTILHYVASLQQAPRQVKNMLQSLIDLKADINSRDEHGRMPLHYAVHAYSAKADMTTEVVEFLLDSKADPFLQDGAGNLPLHVAFHKYNMGKVGDSTQLDPIEVVCSLSAAMNNQKMDLPDTNGNTPLHRAAQHGATISCMHIAKRVKDLNAKNVLGNTPLNLAVSMKQESATIALLQQDSVDVSNPLKVCSRKYTEWEEENKRYEKYWHWDLLRPWKPVQTYTFSLISQVVQREWQGVLYLLMDHLERAGLPKTAVVEAAIEKSKFQLALSLIPKIKNPQDFKSVNSHGQNLLHVLMYTMPTKTSKLHLEVGEELLERGVGLELDSYGCSPLTYAALDQSPEFCQQLIDQKREECVRLMNVTDVKGRTPMAAIFWRMYNDMQQLEDTLKVLLSAGGSLNENLPLPRKDLILREPAMDPDDFFVLWEGPVGVFSPLIGAILAQDKDLVKLLLKLGADPNFPDNDLVTPLMHAVRKNNVEIVKILLKYEETKKASPAKSALKKEDSSLASLAAKTWENKGAVSSSVESKNAAVESMDTSTDQGESKDQVHATNVKVNMTDNHGRTATHYLIGSDCEYGTYENEEILMVLWRCGTPLTESDSLGKTPLDYAVDAKSQKLVTAIQRLLKVSKDFMITVNTENTSWSDGVEWGGPNQYDFNADSLKYVEDITNSEMDTDNHAAQKRVAIVDPASELDSSGEVLWDTALSIPYDILTTVVDVRHGAFGMNNFYKMQIIHQIGKDFYVLLTKWGRIGHTGQYQRTPFKTAELAIKEFQKIFKAKTGNEWSSVKEFKKLKGKHKLVEAYPHEFKQHLKKLHLNVSSGFPSKLPDHVQSLLKELSQQSVLESAWRRCRVNTDLLPFGRVQENVLSQATSVLKSVRDVLEEHKKMLGSSSKDVSKEQDIFEKVSELSSEYYQLIPYAGFAYDKMLPFYSLAQLHKAEQDLEHLIELELTGRMVIGSQLRSKEVNHLDYIYRALSCQIQLLEKNSPETKIILQAIEKDNVGKQKQQVPVINIEAIYRVQRDGEAEEMNSLGLGNHVLLWHGTKSSNVLSILKRGLAVSPIEAVAHGSSLGEGIYFSDAFQKSIKYCDHFQKTARNKFIFLCEVALGDMFVMEDAEAELPFGCQSLLGEGRLHPDPRFDLRLPEGVMIPMGRLLQRQKSREYNEFVVPNKKQSCLRYLIQFNQE